LFASHRSVRPALLQAQHLLFRSILDGEAVQVGAQVCIEHPVKDDVDHARALIVLGPAPAAAGGRMESSHEG
jgi:hypothetical protein